MTVAEYIRQLPDEELAKALSMIILTNMGYSYNDADKVEPKHLLRVLQSDIQKLQNVKTHDVSE